MPLIEQLGQQAAGNVVGGAMGLVLGGIERKKQLQQQQKLQDMQMQGQKAMGIFNREQQMKLWEDTNYSAQMEQLKKAGLNPGLLYGKQGSGGVTATQTGNVSGAQARQGGEAAAMGMQMGQAAMAAAQIELLKAQTEKTKAETGNVPLAGQEITGRIGLMSQQVQEGAAKTALIGIQSEIEKLNKEYLSGTMEDRIKLINQAVEKIGHEISILETQSGLDQATKNDKITIIGQEAIGAALRNALTKAQTTNVQQDTKLKGAQTTNVQQDTKVKEQAINNMIADIRYMDRQWYLGTRHLDVENARTRLQEHGLDLNDPNLTPQIGSIIGGIIGGITGGMFGSKSGHTPVGGFHKR